MCALLSSKVLFALHNSMTTSILCFQELLSSKAYALILLVLSIALLPVANSINFQLSRFGPTSPEILYQGDAVNSVGAVEFNKVNYLCRVGLITYADRVRLWDKSSGELSDFTTHFSFFIDTQNMSSGKYGHGLAFFIAPVGFTMPPNSAGGFLGLFNTTTSDSPNNQMIVIEFDSFSNPEWDPPYEHVGINKNSIASAVQTRWNASVHSGETADAWITYNAATKNLSVFWSYRDEPDYRQNSSLSYQVDLREVLPEWGTIGFSAATGMYVERHNLQSWTFNSNLESTVPISIDMKVVRLAVALAVPLGVLVLGGVLVFLVYRRRSQTRKKQAEAESIFNDELERGAGPRRFSYSEISSATHNFSNERKLGEGGFGGVFKGYLIDLDIPIAVKKFARGSNQGRKQYATEVKIISRLRHRNLVQLIGWCHDEGEFLLVYEFMPNTSLDYHLFGKKSPLSWAVRHKIALGLASGLLYLHEEWEQCVVHRDIKSSNVMLDSSFNAKLGDFGLARFMDHELGPQTTGLAGTFGYMAPEYVNTGKASKESDVYSFGVVVLEIATGRRSVDLINVGTDQKGLVEWVWDLYGKGVLVSAVDERVEKEYDAKQVECLMVVGLWCAHPDQSLRPSVRQAIQVLNFEASFPNLPSKMPVAVYHVPMPSFSSGNPSITATSLEVGR